MTDDPGKDSQCVSEFGSSYRAANSQEVMALWQGNAGGGAPFDVWGTSQVFTMVPKTDGGIQLECPNCAFRSPSPVACVRATP